MDNKLFIVEFGNPDMGLMFFSSTSNNYQNPLYVIATSYDEAVSKAMIYVETKMDERNSEMGGGIIDRDGSLHLPNEETLTVKAVRLATDEVVW